MPRLKHRDRVHYSRGKQLYWHSSVCYIGSEICIYRSLQNINLFYMFDIAVHQTYFTFYLSLISLATLKDPSILRAIYKRLELMNKCLPCHQLSLINGLIVRLKCVLHIICNTNLCNILHKHNAEISYCRATK